VSLDEFVFAALDPEGRLVVLTRERLTHIHSEHPELSSPVFDLLQAVRTPTDVVSGQKEDEEWLYLRGAGPSRWLKVVVVFDDFGTGRIITAFPRRAKP
jgi:hypothetical protein